MTTANRCLTLSLAAMLALPLLGTPSPAEAQGLVCLVEPNSNLCLTRFPSGPYLDYVGPAGGNVYCESYFPDMIQMDRYTVLGQGGYVSTCHIPCSWYPPGDALREMFCHED